MKNKQLILITASLVLLSFWTACNKSEKAVAPPQPGNEFLTSVALVVTNTADTTVSDTAKWVKLNPNDTSAPDLSKAKLTLKTNATYTVKVLFLDESKTPAQDITPEIKDRANYHLICFNIAQGLNLAVKRTDHDTNTPALEVGLQDLFTTSAASSGNLEVLLHHQPNVKNGDCAPGSIDADVNFNITIQ